MPDSKRHVNKNINISNSMAHITEDIGRYSTMSKWKKVIRIKVRQPSGRHLPLYMLSAS